MDLRRLEYFLAVVEHGRVTVAANELHVAQPSLSQAIRALERELGAELFVRNGRGLTPTPAGLALVEPARRVLRDLAAAKAAVGDVIELAAGRLDIAAHDRLGYDPLAPVLAAFHRRHGGVPVRLHEPRTEDELVRMLVDGRCELALAYLAQPLRPTPADEPAPTPAATPAPTSTLTSTLTSTSTPGPSPAPVAGPVPAGPDPVPAGPAAQAALAAALVARRIVQHEVWVLLPPGSGPVPDPLPLAELDGRVVVDTITGFGAVRAAMLAMMRTAGIRMRPGVRTRHVEAITPLVVAGAGVAFTSPAYAREAARAGAVVRRLDPGLSVDVMLLHRPGGLSPAARGFVSVLHAELGLEPPVLGPAEAEL
jgi:DNA-binding transcriptional LysR family regulator